MAESVSPSLGTASLVYPVSASQPASLPSTHKSLGSCESAPHEEPEGNAPLSLALGISWEPYSFKFWVLLPGWP